MSVKDLLTGAAFGHPSHPFFVHFPTALYPVALVLGILSRTAEEPVYLDAATIVLGVGVGFALLAALTGLVDWLGMIPGSTKRRAATTHMLVQVAAQGFAAGALVAHLLDLDGAASSTALALLAIAVLLVSVGNWFGGVLVYRMGMRVGAGSTNQDRTPERSARPS